MDHHGIEVVAPIVDEVEDLVVVVDDLVVEVVALVVEEDLAEIKKVFE